VDPTNRAWARGHYEVGFPAIISAIIRVIKVKAVEDELYSFVYIITYNASSTSSTDVRNNENAME
jgi:hypothetical protein